MELIGLDVHMAAAFWLSLPARPSLAGVATGTAPPRGIVCVLRLGPPWGAGLSEWPESNGLVHTSSKAVRMENIPEPFHHVHIHMYMYVYMCDL